MIVDAYSTQLEISAEETKKAAEELNKGETPKVVFKQLKKI